MFARKSKYRIEKIASTSEEPVQRQFAEELQRAKEVARTLCRDPNAAVHIIEQRAPYRRWQASLLASGSLRVMQLHSDGLPTSRADYLAERSYAVERTRARVVGARAQRRLALKARFNAELPKLRRSTSNIKAVVCTSMEPPLPFGSHAEAARHFGTSVQALNRATRQSGRQCCRQTFENADSRLARLGNVAAPGGSPNGRISDLMDAASRALALRDELRRRSRLRLRSDPADVPKRQQEAEGASNGSCWHSPVLTLPLGRFGGLAVAC